MKKMLIAGAVLILFSAVMNVWRGDWIEVIWKLSVAAFVMIAPRESGTPKPVMWIVAVTMTVSSVLVLVQAFARQ